MAYGEGAGTGLEVMVMGRDQIRHLSPLSSLIGSRRKAKVGRPDEHTEHKPVMGVWR